MTDVQLAQAVDRRNRADVGEIQCMPRVGAHPTSLDERGRAHDFAVLGRGACIAESSVVRVKRVRVRPRVNLAKRESAARRRFDLPFIGIDERAHRNPRAAQTCHRIANARLLRRHIESAFGRHLLTFLGHKHRELRFERNRDGDHLVGRGHLKIELRMHHRFDARQIAVLNMATIFAQMNGDPVCATSLRLESGLDRIGLIGLACLAHGGDMIDVDAEFSHKKFANPLLDAQFAARVKGENE